MTARALAVAAATLALASACGPDEAPTPPAPAEAAAPPAAPLDPRISRVEKPVSFDLVERFLIADVHWQEGWRRPRPSAEKRGHTLYQQRGSSVTFYLALPAAPVLRGAAIWMSGSDGDPSERTVVVELKCEDGRSETLVEQVFEPGAPSELPLDLDLRKFAGQNVALRLRVAEPRPRQLNRAPTNPALRWTHLELVGAEADWELTDAPDLRQRRNVILILFDTLRADRTQPYGATDVETPTLTRLAGRGVTFSRAHSNASWTTPSVATMLTGVHPGTHKIDGTGWFGAGDRSVTRLGSNLPYLPELLQRAGYRTHAVVTNFMISAAFGFARGFDDMVEYTNPEREKELPERSPEALAEYVWTRNIEPFLKPGKAPFFLYLHELNPHDPYLPPEPYASRYDTVEGEPPEQDSKLLQQFSFDPSVYDANDIAHLEALYRGEIAFMDAYLGALIDRFEAGGWLDDTVLVFVSDHGEAFNEHGSLGHGNGLFESLMRVPVFLSVPHAIGAGVRSSVPFSLVDLAPTLLDLAGEPIPDGMQGRSVLPYLVAGEAVEPSWPVFARARFIDYWYDGVTLGRWKLIKQSGRIPRNAQRSKQLFDLQSDPGETRDVIDEHPIVAGTLEQMLAWQIWLDDSQRLTVDSLPVDSLDPEVRRNLEELGYLQPQAQE